MKRASLFSSIVVAITVFSLPAQESQPSAQDLWLLSDKQAAVFSETGDTQLAKLDLSEYGLPLSVSPDGSLMAMARWGEINAKVSPWTGNIEVTPAPGGGSSVVIARRPGYEVVQRPAVAFRPAFAEFSADGARLAVISLGSVNKNKEKHIAPQVAVVDVAAGKAIRQLELASEPLQPWHVVAIGKLLIPCQGIPKRPDAPPELAIYDTGSGTSNKIALPAAPKAWLDSGVESLRYLELENGLAVVSSEGKLLGEPFQIGNQKPFLARIPRSRRWLLAGKTKKDGQLLVVEEGRVIKTLAVPPPVNVPYDKDLTRLFLCASKQGVILDLQNFAEQSRIPLPEQFREARLSPDEKRLYVCEVGDRVSVVDLATKQTTARFVSGRGGVKFLRAAASGLIEGFVSAAARANPEIFGGYNSYSYQRPQAVQSLAFSPGGDLAYVFNDQTLDITVAETKGHTTPRKIPTDLPADKEFLWQTPDGRHLIFCGATKLLILDTEKGDIQTEQEFKDSYLRYLPELGLIFIRRDNTLEVYRPSPFEKIKDFGPEYGFHASPMLQEAKQQVVGRKGGLLTGGMLTMQVPKVSLAAAGNKELSVHPPTRRMFLVSAKGAGIFDYELNPVGLAEGLTKLETVRLLPAQQSLLK